MENEFTELETERQDYVDNRIHEFIEDMIPDAVDYLEWNIENIGIIRDALQEVLVDRLGAMTEMEFYPYRELKNG